MDYIRKNLGPNKVTVSINSSKFDETLLDRDHNTDPNPFDSMDNIIELFKPKNFNAKNLLYISKENVHIKPEEPKPIRKTISIIPKITDNVKPNVKLDVKPDVKLDVKPNVKLDVKLDVKPDVKLDVKPDVKLDDTLLYLLYELTDNLVSLYNINEINKKLDNFKNELIKNLTNENSMYKKLELNKVCKLEELIINIKDASTNRLPLIIYISRLMNKSIAVKKGDTILYARTVGNAGIYICNDIMKIEEIDANTLDKRVTSLKIDYYLKNNYVDKIDIALVKELREIAENLEIPKFKSLLKNELKVAIKEIIEKEKLKLI